MYSFTYFHVFYLTPKYYVIIFITITLLFSIIILIRLYINNSLLIFTIGRF